MDEQNAKKARKYLMFIKVTQVLNSVDILNHFNSEAQLKDTEYAVRNKLIDLLTELKGLNLWRHWF